MKKSRATLRAFLMTLATALTLCMVFVGATFAWFTSTVTSSGNRIKAGTLQIKLYQKVGDTFVDISTKDQGDSSIFSIDNFQPNEQITQTLRVYNAGSLDVNFDVVLTDVSITVDQAIAGSDGYDITKDLDIFVAERGKTVRGAFSLYDLTNGNCVIFGTLKASTEAWTGTLDDSTDSFVEFDLKVVYNYLATIQGAGVEFDIVVNAAQTTSTDYQAPALPSERIRQEVKIEKVTDQSGTEVEKPISIKSGEGTNTTVELKPSAILSEEQKKEEKNTVEFSAAFIDQSEGKIDQNGSFTFESDELSAPLATVKLEIKVNDTPVTDFEEAIRITVFVATGLKKENIKITYNGTYSGKHANESDKIDAKIISYNDQTGELVFEVWHFSQYDVIVAKYPVVAVGSDLKAQIEALAPNSTLIIGKGEHILDIKAGSDYAINIPTSVTIIGEAGSVIKLASTATCYSVLGFTQSSASTFASIVLDGLTIDCNGINTKGIFCKKSAGVAMKGIVVKNCTVTNSANDGIDLNNCDAPVVTGCTVTNIVDCAIEIESYINGATVTNNIIDNISATQNAAIDVTKGEGNILVSGNTITNITEHTSDSGSSHTKKAAILISSVQHYDEIIIENNTISNTKRGITIYKVTADSAADRIYIRNNTITKYDLYAICTNCLWVANVGADINVVEITHADEAGIINYPDNGMKEYSECCEVYLNATLVFSLPAKN